MSLTLDPISRLSRDLAQAAVSLSIPEVRYLVDAYYLIQANRIVASNQIRALTESAEPHEVITWLAQQNDVLENQIKRALDRWTEGQELGVWCKGITGIGPVISAGLMAHIDIARAPTVGHIWSFAGLNPEQKWEKKTKRPWNAQLKTLCWKIGESFVKVSGNPKSTYGRLYRERKEYEERRNGAGECAQQASEILSNKKFGKDTEAYKHLSAGKLPPAHVHARAKRYAVKIFLAHYHETAYRLHFGTEPPKPYAIAILGHAHEIAQGA
jgi:hypothetical protein